MYLNALRQTSFPSMMYLVCWCFLSFFLDVPCLLLTVSSELFRWTRKVDIITKSFSDCVNSCIFRRSASIHMSSNCLMHIPINKKCLKFESRLNQIIHYRLCLECSDLSSYRYTRHIYDNSINFVVMGIHMKIRCISYLFVLCMITFVQQCIFILVVLIYTQCYMVIMIILWTLTYV